MQQVHVKPRRQRRKTEAEEEVEIKQDEEARAKRDAELDDLLDDIDTVLVENAEQFVKDYVQKGGE
jgi:ubiquitin-like protein Pup